MSLSGISSKPRKKGLPIDRSVVDEVLVSKVASMPTPPSKRAKSGAPCSSRSELVDPAGSIPAEFDDVPPSRSIFVSPSPRYGSSTAVGTEVPAPIASRGPGGVVNAAVEGIALVMASLPALFSNTMMIGDAVLGEAKERRAREAAEMKLSLERQTRENDTLLARQAREDVEKRFELERRTRESTAEQLKLS